VLMMLVKLKVDRLLNSMLVFNFFNNIKINPLNNFNETMLNWRTMKRIDFLEAVSIRYLQCVFWRKQFDLFNFILYPLYISLLSFDLSPDKQ